MTMIEQLAREIADRWSEEMENAVLPLPDPKVWCACEMAKLLLFDAEMMHDDDKLNMEHLRELFAEQNER